jgi:hypothetical protein
MLARQDPSLCGEAFKVDAEVQIFTSPVAANGKVWCILTRVCESSQRHAKILLALTFDLI